MRVVARDGDSLLLTDESAGAILLPDGAVLLRDVAVLLGHGQWRDSDEAVPPHAPADLAGRLSALRAEIDSGATVKS